MFENEDDMDMVMSETNPSKRVLLQILDARGNIEDIMFDINEIKLYIDKLYEEYPEAG